MSSQNTFTYATPEEVIDAAKSIMESMMKKRGIGMADTETVGNYLKMRLGAEEREVFCVLFLDSQHQLIAVENLFYGTLDGASVYSREVVKAALRHNAGAVVLSHNHPSIGSLEPSRADLKITKRLQEALELVEVRVLDHVIVSGSECMSFAQRGLM
jgi:DNA repair protein RadC